MKEIAARLLGLRHPEGRVALDTLSSALGDASAWVRVSAAGAIWRLSGDSERIGPVLRQGLEEGGVAGINAVAVLIEMGGESTEVLSDALGSDSRRVRSLAYRVIGQLGPRVGGLAERLRELLRDPDYPDAKWAQAALKLVD